MATALVAGRAIDCCTRRDRLLHDLLRHPRGRPALDEHDSSARGDTAERRRRGLGGTERRRRETTLGEALGRPRQDRHSLAAEPARHPTTDDV